MRIILYLGLFIVVNICLGIHAVDYSLQKELSKIKVLTADDFVVECE